MRILITNDDNIHAPGLEVMIKIAQSLGDDIWIVAPEADQSGIGHALSLSQHLRVRKLHHQHYAVNGTPTDCVLMGLRHLMQGAKPDVILSGVNLGQNVAEDMTYSGTIGAAIEGTLNGIPSFALSQAYWSQGDEEIHWDCAATHAPALIKKLMAAGMPEYGLYNINFPHCTPDQVTGIAATVQGKRPQPLLTVKQRRDGRGLPYHWLVYGRIRTEDAPETDRTALANRQISILPLSLDMTDHKAREKIIAAGIAK